MRRPPLEVAAVVRQDGDVCRERYGHTLCGAQHRALRAIEWCYTAARGGHNTRGDHCGPEGLAYNPCGNRRCPQCHGVARAAWRANRPHAVLDTSYEHAVFPLPQALSPLILHHPPLLYGLLWRPVAQTLLDIGGAPTQLGAELGGLAVLPTWGQPLQPHPHLHGVLPAGGLAPDGSHGVPCRPDVFLPVRGLSRRFRRLSLEGLEHRDGQGQRTLSGRCRALGEPTPWRR